MKKALLFLLLAVPLYSIAQWTEIANLGFPLKDILFDSDTSGFVVGTNGIYHTDNSGSDWEEITLFDSPADEEVYINTECTSIFMLDNLWFVTGQNSLTTKAVIFRMNTDDLNWEVVFEGEVSSKLNCISGSVGSDSYTAAGDDGLVLYSEDGDGEVWEILETGYFNDWRATAGNTLIGGEDGLIKKTGDTWELYNDLNVQDFFDRVGTDYLVTHESIYTGVTFDNPRNKFIGDLQANCVAYRGIDDDWTCIGTENGIYASKPSSPQEWGRFPSTYGYDVNQIVWPDLDSYQSLAICESGAILRLVSWSNYMPYTGFKIETGGCADSILTLEITSHESDFYNWYLDGEWVGDDGEELVITIPGPPGYHEVMLTRWDGGTESVTLDVYMADPPTMSEDVTFLDTMICKEGISEVLISVSNSIYKYRLHEIPTDVIFDEAVGVGADLLLNTGVLIDSALFRISVTSAFAECELFFPDTMNVIVENPSANFKAIPINADLNEPVFFNNLSENANIYEWTFLDDDAEFVTSGDPDVINKFSTEGLKSIQLVATTENSCSDTVLLENVFSYDENSLEYECWSHQLVDEDYGDNPGFGGLDIDSDNNVYISSIGSYIAAPSKQGFEIFGNSSDAFMNKYSTNGVLKWNLNIIHDSDPYSLDARITNVFIDQDKNVIIPVGFRGFFELVSFNGDTLSIKTCYDNPEIDHPCTYNNAIVKMDSLGNILWYSLLGVPITGSQGGIEICVDSMGYVYSATGFTSMDGARSFVVEGDGTYNYLDDLPDDSGTLLIKWSPNGEILSKSTLYGIGVGSGFRFRDFACSNEGDLYLINEYKTDFNYQWSGGTVYFPDPEFAEEEIMMIKLDSFGELQWSTEIYVSDTEPGHTLSSYRNIEYDNYSDAIYISGSTTHYLANLVFKSNGAEDYSINFKGRTFLAKYSSEGDLRWVNGATERIANFSGIGFDEDGNVYSGGNLTNFYAVTDTFKFTSQDGNYFAVDNREKGVFINKYDSEGNILQSFFNQEEPVSISTGGSGQKVKIDQNGNIFFGGAAKGGPETRFAGDPLLDLGGAIVAKFNPIGCISDTGLDLEGYVSADERLSIKYYPNPANEFMILEVPTQFLENHLIITDQTGKEVKRVWIVNDRCSVNLSNLSKGVYFLSIEGRSLMHAGKLVID